MSSGLCILGTTLKLLLKVLSTQHLLTASDREKWSTSVDSWVVWGGNEPGRSEQAVGSVWSARVWLVCLRNKQTEALNLGPPLSKAIPG